MGHKIKGRDGKLFNLSHAGYPAEIERGNTEKAKQLIRKRMRNLEKRETTLNSRNKLKLINLRARIIDLEND